MARGLGDAGRAAFFLRFCVSVWNGWGSASVFVGWVVQMSHNACWR